MKWILAAIVIALLSALLYPTLSCGSPAEPEGFMEMGGTPLDSLTDQFRTAVGHHPRISWGRPAKGFPLRTSFVTQPVDGIWFVLTDQLKLGAANLHAFLEQNPKVSIRITSTLAEDVLDPIDPENNSGRAIIVIFQAIPVHATGEGAW